MIFVPLPNFYFYFIFFKFSFWFPFDILVAGNKHSSNVRFMILISKTSVSKCLKAGILSFHGDNGIQDHHHSLP